MQQKLRSVEERQEAFKVEFYRHTNISSKNPTINCIKRPTVSFQ